MYSQGVKGREIVGSMKPEQAPTHKIYIHPPLWPSISVEALRKEQQKTRV